MQQSLDLIFDSRNRSLANNYGGFENIFQNQNWSELEAFAVKRVGIPYTFYQVIGKTFTATYNATPISFAIPDSNYTLTQLAAIITQGIAGVIGGGLYTCTFNTNPNSPTGKITFGTTAANTHSEDFTALTALFKELGFDPILYPAQIPPRTGPYVGSTLNHQYIFLRSKQLALRCDDLLSTYQFPSNREASRQTDIVAIIPIDNQAPYSRIEVSYPTWNFHHMQPTVFESIDFYTTFEDGSLINFNQSTVTPNLPTDGISINLVFSYGSQDRFLKKSKIENTY
jgi:hypothetical protein